MPIQNSDIMNHETAPVLFSLSLSLSSGVALGICELYGSRVHNSKVLTSHICGICHAVTNDRGVSLSPSFFFLFLFIHSCVSKYESVALGLLWQEMECYHDLGQQRRKRMLQ